MPPDGVQVAKASHESALFGRANVVGVAVGNKVTGGHETDERCIVVFVARKRPESQLWRRDIVPRELDGIHTDVVETGRFRALSLVEPKAVDRTRRIRPAPGGVSIGHFRITAGTLGVLAHRRGQAVILSNNHVLADANGGRPGDLILQPGPADGGMTQDAIGRLIDFVPIQFNERPLGILGRFLERIIGPILAFIGLGLKRLPDGGTNLVDVAIAEPITADLVDPEILGIGRVAGTTEAAIGLRVRKSGRTTALTAGKVTALDAVVEVDYGGKTAIFRQQIVSDILSRGGDSGSLIVDDGNRAVGLLFAGGATTTLINPIGAVLQFLDLTLE